MKSNYFDLQLSVKMWQYLYKPSRYKKKQIMKSNFIKLQLSIKMWQYLYKPFRYKNKQIMKSYFIDLQLSVKVWQYLISLLTFQEGEEYLCNTSYNTCQHLCRKCRIQFCFFLYLEGLPESYNLMKFFSLYISSCTWKVYKETTSF